MSKWTKGIMVVLSLVLISAGVGCVALSKHVTTAEIDSKCVAYVVEAGVADANEFTGWPSLAKAEKLKAAVDCAYTVNMFELQQEMDGEDLKYNIHIAAATRNYKAGLKREEALFGEKGLIALGLSMAGFGTLTGFVGLARKRPGDVTPQEVTEVVSQATGKVNGDLSEKEKQLVEVVKGVQKFINTYSDKQPETVSALKEICNKAQDVSTQVAVATIKKATL